jgi:hypothetical protein
VIEHEVSIAGCDGTQGPYLAGCRCGWTAEIRPAWPLSLEDARRHLEAIEIPEHDRVAS